VASDRGIQLVQLLLLSGVVELQSAPTLTSRAATSCATAAMDDAVPLSLPLPLPLPLPTSMDVRSWHT
jgi:hypothetical protein